MRIVVLDGYTLNAGDLSWDKLKSLGKCTIYDRTEPDQTVARARDAEIVLTNKTSLTSEVIAQLPNLKYIGVLATGYNTVDCESAKRRGIPITNIPAYGTQSVAQMVFAHLLNLTQHVAQHAETVESGQWTNSVDFCYWRYPLWELDGRTMGIVGFGRIGRATARLASAFGMRVLACARRQPRDVVQGVAITDLYRIFSESDVISLHCPLTSETRNLVNRKNLAKMKPTSLLINTSRGPLIDEQALADALNSGKIAGAGLDVLSVEPPDAGNPLLSAKNCYITPHIAWATSAARKRLLDMAVSNVRAFLENRPQNIVNL